MSYYNSLTEAWVDLIGRSSVWPKVSVRGKETREVLGHSLCFPMERAILNCPPRNLSYDFMYREAWWILSGQNRVDLLASHAPSIRRFSDDGIRLSGAYGPKVVDQIGYVVDTLNHDPSSRQAVINIWRERPGMSKDIPCTLSAQFLIRDNHLHMVITMRSSDMWLGLPYDVFTFTMLACQVGLELNKFHGLNLKLGNCYHTAASRHVYMSDWEKIQSVNSQNLFHKQWDHGPDIDLKQICSIFPDSNSFISVLYDRSVNKSPLPLLSWLSM